MKNFSIMVLGTIFWMTAAAGLVHAASTDLEKDLAKALHGSRAVAAQGATELKKGGNGRSASAQLKKYAEEVAALDLLQRERFRVQGEKVAVLGSKARARHAAMVSRYQVAMDRLLPLLQQTTSGPAANNLSTWQELQKLLDSILPPSQPPLHGTLPYRHFNATTQLPTTAPLITPAYRTVAATTSSDLEATPEAPRSAAIVDLAQSLAWSPAAIYQWVTDNVATEWYWGAMKGAEETLQQRSGNDADQAALLVALLRASGYPTRYVRGVIEFYPQDLARVANQTGVQDPARLGDFFQKAGIPYTPTLSASTVVNYQIEHLWVETYVPYANYRGVLADVQGKIWLPLDSSIKVAGYDSTVGALDLFSEVGSPLATLREDYLSSFLPESPLEFLRTRSQAFLDQNHPGEAYATLLNQRSQRASTLNILPASLQFREVVVTGEYTQLPASLLHQLRFLVPGVSEPVLDVTLDLYTLSNRKVVLSYEPESVEDQEIINSWGGLDNTPAYLVRLRPVLLVDGERLAVGQEGFARGVTYPLTEELIAPGGGATFSNELQSGYPTVFGVAAQKALVPAPEAVKNEAIDLFHRDALTYIDNWNQAENELAALLRTPIVRPLPTVIMLGGALEVTTLLGEPQGVEWKGLFIDADLRVAEVLGTGAAAAERERLFMELSALQGSVLENQIFESALNVESISTAKLLGLAADAQIPLLTLDAANIESELPTLSLADNVRADIVAAVGAGLTVRIPRFALTYHNWNGVGYIKENPTTGEAGYMLAGVIAGGATVLGVEMWPEEMRAVMIAPYQGEANLDPNQANSITAALPNAVKLATVGTESASPLMVLVRDAANLPVSWAPVVFSVRSGGGLLLDTAVIPHVWGATVTVLSGPDGIARARFKPGTSTSIDPISYTRDGDSYANIVGQNLIDAQLGSGTAASLRSPLAVLGFAAAPDVAQSIYYGNGNGGDILGSSGSAIIFLKDQYGNPVANHPVTFTALNAEPESSSQCNDLGAFAAERIKAQLIDQRESCLESNPVWGECPAANSSLALVSLSDGGAGVDVLLGAVPYAKYPVQASYAGSSGPVTQTVRHRSNTLGSCFSTEAPSSKVVVTYLGHVDEFSVNVDARPAGVPATLKVKNYLLSEEGQVESSGVILVCGETTLNCGRVVGDGVFSVTDPASLRLTVNSTAAQHLADFGLFEAQVNLPLGLNTLALAGTAEKPMLKIDNSCPYCGTPYTTSTPVAPTARTAQVWGVKLETPQTFQVAVDSSGYLTENTDFAYTILPAAYRANMAQLLLYRNGELIFVAATNKSGTPSVTFPAGFWFDRNSTYELEVLLNNQGDADEISSGRIPLLTLVNMVDLRIDGLAEGYEDSVGAFVLLNNDYDEGTVDDVTGLPVRDNLGEPKVVQPDDEIKKAFLVLDGQGVATSGQWKLLVSDPAKLQVFRDDGQGGYQLVPLNTLKAVTLPATIPLYIEGLAESAGIKTEEIRVIFTAAGVPEMQDVVPVTVVDFDMAVDGDRNRTIDFQEAKDESYQFWVNNDRDTRTWSWSELRNVEDDQETGNDSADNEISCLRDLEDFARLQVKLGGNISTGALTYKMQMVQVEGNNALPQINLFQAVDASDKYLGLDLLVNENQPSLQLQKRRLGIVGESSLSLPSDQIQGSQDSFFLFEGRTKGRGQLRITANYAGVPVLERNVKLDIEDISFFYDHFIVGESGNFAAPVNAAVNSIGLAEGDSREGSYQPSSDEYVLFAHGWDVEPWLKRRWAETVFKRLWWQGFKGKVGLFDWPCETFSVLPGLLNFDTSEYHAWHSAPALKILLETLNQRHPGQVRLLAHSQGNATAGEAINLGSAGLVHSYVASQAAISASLYHQTENDTVPDIFPALDTFTYETPEVFGHDPGTDPLAPYWANVSQKLGGRLYSYFNELDYALTVAGPLTVAWEFNNKTKPDNTGGYDYIGNVTPYPNPPIAEEGFVHGQLLTTEAGSDFIVDRDLRFPLNRYEIYAFGAESRTKALGAVRPEGGFNEFAGISNAVSELEQSPGSRNLRNQLFGFNDEHYSHSRQFRSNVVAEQIYWKAFMNDTALSTTYPYQGGN